MSINYYLSWDTQRPQRPRPSRRALLRLAIVLMLPLLLTLLALLVVIGHDARENQVASSAFEQTGMRTYDAYAFMLPDFMPGAGSPGRPDLYRLTWDFITGCGIGFRITAMLASALAVVLAYQLGRRFPSRTTGDNPRLS